MTIKIRKNASIDSVSEAANLRVKQLRNRWSLACDNYEHACRKDPTSVSYRSHVRTLAFEHLSDVEELAAHLARLVEGRNYFEKLGLADDRRQS